MSKVEKVTAKILSGRADKNLDFDDLCYILERAGFKSLRQREPSNLLQKKAW